MSKFNPALRLDELVVLAFTIFKNLTQILKSYCNKRFNNIIRTNLVELKNNG